MSVPCGTWAIVMAAGDGTRLSALTTDEAGTVVPKQFCSLAGGRTLVQEAMQRARRVVPNERVCALVARRHEKHWRRLLGTLPAANIIVQPRNCGTALGVLLGVLRILERDALARIIFFPSDHFVEDEERLAESVRAAARLLARKCDDLLLIGIRPEGVDPDLGYILPGKKVRGDAHRVVRFVEKPKPADASELIAQGALWNSFIFAAQARSLLALIRSRMPQIVADLTDVLTGHQRRIARTYALEELYQRLPVVDFSHAVVQGAESRLQVQLAPACGWADLGTPLRVAKTLQRLRVDPAPKLPETGYRRLVPIDLSRKLQWSQQAL